MQQPVVTHSAPNLEQLDQLIRQLTTCCNIDSLQEALTKLAPYSKSEEFAAPALNKLVEILGNSAITDPKAQAKVVIAALSFPNSTERLNHFILQQENPSDLLKALRIGLVLISSPEPEIATLGIELLVKIADDPKSDKTIANLIQEELVRFVTVSWKEPCIAIKLAGTWLAKEIGAENRAVLDILGAEINHGSGQARIECKNTKNTAGTNHVALEFNDSLPALCIAAEKQSCVELAYRLIKLAAPSADQCVSVIANSALSKSATSEGDLILLKEIALGNYGEKLLVACYESLVNKPYATTFKFVNDILPELLQASERHHFVKNAAITANACLRALTAGIWDEQRHFVILGFLGVLKQLNIPSTNSDCSKIFDSKEILDDKGRPAVNTLRERTKPIHPDLNSALISGSFGKQGVQVGVYNIALAVRRGDHKQLGALLDLADKLNTQTSGYIVPESQLPTSEAKLSLFDAVIENIVLLWPHQPCAESSRLFELLGQAWKDIDQYHRFQLAKRIISLENKPRSLGRFILELNCRLFLRGKKKHAMPSATPS